jgi:transcriptional regulator with XRE-family HTH domain
MADPDRNGHSEHSATTTETAGAGALLRRWRESRHLSQLELALEAEVSTRHLSFVESGRATPSCEMLLKLAHVLDVSHRERNALLLAAGYAPLYRETPLRDQRMSQVRTALRLILKQNEPRSAFAFDRYWNVVMANAAFIRFLTFVFGRPPRGLEPLDVCDPPQWNVLHLVFDPKAVRRIIVNWEPVAKALLDHAHRAAMWSRDAKLDELIASLLAYPGVPARWREPDLEDPQALLLPFELDLGGGKIARMFSTVATLSTPQDVTLQDLHVEAFYAADEKTEAVLADF